MSADGKPGELLTFFDQAALSADATVDSMGRQALRQLRDDGGRRLPDVELDGARAFRVGAWERPGIWLERIGTVHQGRYVTVVVSTARKKAPQALPDVVASILATFEWRR